MSRRLALAAVLLFPACSQPSPPEVGIAAPAPKPHRGSVAEPIDPTAADWDGLATAAIEPPRPVVRRPTRSHVRPRPVSSSPDRRINSPRVGSDDLLACIRRIESGGRYDAVSASGTYRGAYQFDRQTFASIGGHGDPASASPAEQDAAALRLIARRGLQPWPTPSRVCG